MQHQIPYACPDFGHAAENHAAVLVSDLTLLSVGDSRKDVCSKQLRQLRPHCFTDWLCCVVSWLLCIPDPKARSVQYNLPHKDMAAPIIGRT